MPASFMQSAFALAQQAGTAGEVPVAAVITHKGKIIAAAQNEMRTTNDPTAHAELLAIKEAIKALNGQRLADCDLYVTLEPCTMCAGAIAHARLRRVYYGARDVKGGAVDSGVRFFESETCHHAPEIIGGVMEKECASLLKDFFAARR